MTSHWQDWPPQVLAALRKGVVIPAHPLALNAERKKLSKEIGGMRSRGQDSLQLENRVRKIREEIARLNEDVDLVDRQQKEMLLEIPNLPHLKVPIGKDASANPVVRSWGAKPNLDSPLDHVTIGTNLKLFDLERASKLSGSGFICFTGAGARLAPPGPAHPSPAP